MVLSSLYLRVEIIKPIPHQLQHILGKPSKHPFRNDQSTPIADSGPNGCHNGCHNTRHRKEHPEYIKHMQIRVLNNATISLKKKSSVLEQRYSLQRHGASPPGTHRHGLIQSNNYSRATIKGNNYSNLSTGVITAKISARTNLPERCRGRSSSSRSDWAPSYRPRPRPRARGAPMAVAAPGRCATRAPRHHQTFTNIAKKKKKKTRHDRILLPSVTLSIILIITAVLLLIIGKKRLVN